MSMDNEKLVLIDPVNYTQNQRAEFRLPPGIALYKSNFKLLNAGCTSDNASADGINELAGNLATIRNIFLMDGSKVLDQVNQVGIYGGFKLGYNVDNQQACDINGETIHNNMGRTAFVTDYNTGLQEALSAPWTFGQSLEKQATNNPLTTPRIYLDLSLLLNSLRNMGEVHTGLFKNLRVVVEYTNNSDDWETGFAAATRNTTQPLLAVCEVNDPERASNFLENFNRRGVSYMAIESDQVRLPSVSPTAWAHHPTQTQNSRLNGFNNKTINRMLISKNPLVNQNSHTSSLLKKLESDALFNQRLQLRVNGVNLLPNNGITNNNQRLAMLHDSWGQCVSRISSNMAGFNDLTNLTASTLTECGRLDYFGVNTGGKKIRDLQLTFERQGVYDVANADQTVSRFNRPYNLNVICEVAKAIQPDGRGGYRCVYV